jgi:SAM-dependent methyltransferase
VNTACVWQGWKDCALFPLRTLLSTTAARRLGLTPIDDERVIMALRHCRGRLLDVGCGMNELVKQYKQYGRGVGVDVYQWDGIDLLCDTRRLPFHDGAFDTVTLLACLNHIEAKARVLQEARRVLAPAGQLLVTMIGPVTGYVCHKVRYRYDPDQQERRMQADEQYGLTGRHVNALLEEQGFQIAQVVPFLWGLNRLYIAGKRH